MSRGVASRLLTCVNPCEYIEKGDRDKKYQCDKFQWCEVPLTKTLGVLVEIVENCVIKARHIIYTSLLN